MKTLLTYIFVLLLVASCGKNNIYTETNISAEEYAVYSSVIRLLHPLSIPAKYRDKILFVRDSTIVPYSLVGYYDTSRLVIKRPNIADLLNPKPIPKFDLIDVFATLQKVYFEYDWNNIRNSFNVAIKSNVRLDSARLSWHTPGCLISKQEFRSVCIEDSTSERYRIYRDSIINIPGYSNLKVIQLSRVGFDPTKSIAIVFYDSGRSGGGNYGFYVLKKENMEWVAVKRFMIGYM